MRVCIFVKGYEYFSIFSNSEYDLDDHLLPDTHKTSSRLASKHCNKCGSTHYETQLTKKSLKQICERGAFYCLIINYVCRKSFQANFTATLFQLHSSIAHPEIYKSKLLTRFNCH